MRVIVLALLALLPLTTYAADQNVKVRLRYYVRPPYIQEQRGQIFGLSASKAIAAFIESGIPYELINTPPSRQLMMIAANTGYDCALGWFKTPQRERIARFTDTIQQDHRWIVVANKNVRTDDASILNLFNDKKLRFLKKDQFSYGAYIDSLIASKNPTTISTGTDLFHMIQIIHSNRADYMFSSEFEADFLIEKSGLSKNDFAYLRFPDLPAGEPRHIMCSKKVPETTIRRLDEALQKQTKVSGSNRRNVATSKAATTENH